MNIQNFDTLSAISVSTVEIPAGYVEALERGIVAALPYQITIETTATAQIEGRISAAHEWVIIGASVTGTAAGLLSVAMPEMRLNCTAWTAGDVDAAILLP
jgi:hypothetical protein